MKYWIKLRIDMLDKPEVATLPDRLWRRAIELSLIAGRLDDNGRLPPVNQIAWILRVETDDMLLDLSQLERAGAVYQDQGIWYAANYERDQRPLSEAERKNLERSRKRDKHVTQNVTEMSRSVSKSRSRLKKREDVNNANVINNDDVVVNAIIATTTTTKTDSDFFELISEFKNLFEREPDNNDITAINSMGLAGITVADLRQAAAELDEKNYLYTSALSLIEPARLVSIRRRRTKKSKQKSFIDDPYADFIEH